MTLYDDVKVLLALKDAPGGLALAELLEATGLDEGTVTVSLMRLEGTGHVAAARRWVPWRPWRRRVVWRVVP